MSNCASFIIISRYYGGDQAIGTLFREYISELCRHTDWRRRFNSSCIGTFLNVTLVLIEKDFFNILPPSSDEDNGATNDFGESFDFDGNYTLNGTFDDHLGTDK